MWLVNAGSAVFSATIIARILSGVFNFSLNKLWVFEKGESSDTPTSF